MKTDNPWPLSPARAMEALCWRFGAFESIAKAVLGATTYTEETWPPMDKKTAWAVFQFADDLKAARAEAEAWTTRQLHEMQELERAALRAQEWDRGGPVGGLREELARTREGSVAGPATRSWAESRHATESDEGAGVGERSPARSSAAPADPPSHSRSFEGEGSERRTSGSVAVTHDAQWSASLAVPIGGEGGTVFLHLERSDAGTEEYAGDDEVGFFLAETEVEPVATLIQGVVAQAYRDGVLHRAAPGGAPDDEP